MLLTKIVADTRFSPRSRVVSGVILLPRYLLAEANTHRLPSRNAGSTRAIPTERLIAAVRARTFVPWHWLQNKKGMTGGGALSPETAEECRQRWLEDVERAIESTRFYAKRKLLKGLANRPLDLFSYVEWLVTFRAESLPHFFNLRNDPGADAQFRDVVDDFERTYLASVPVESTLHAPFVSLEEQKAYPLRECLLVSAARNRRVSVMGLDGDQPSWEDDVAKATEMLCTSPLHASPYEHPCFVPKGRWRPRFAAGNLALPDEWVVDFTQFRKTLQGEFMRVRKRVE